MEVREPVVAYGKTTLSVGEYLEWEHNTSKRHEYYKGELFLLPSPKIIHNIISINFLGSLVTRGREKDCHFFGSDQRICVPLNDFFTYADSSIVCGEPDFRKEDDSSLLNPTVLIETFSAATHQYDREDKFRLYQDIPVLREYILVDSGSVSIEVWHLNERQQWRAKEYKGLTQSVLLPTLGLEVPLAEIYEGTYLALS